MRLLKPLVTFLQMTSFSVLSTASSFSLLYFLSISSSYLLYCEILGALLKFKIRSPADTYFAAYH